MNSFFSALVRTIPKIRRPLQLVGLIEAIASVVVLKSIVPGNTLAILCAGSIGVLFIVFGQVFAFLDRTRGTRRERSLLLALSLFVTLIVILAIISAYVTTVQLRTPLPQIDLTIAPKEYAAATQIPVGTVLTLTLTHVPIDATVTWTQPLRGTLNTTNGDTVSYEAITVGAESIIASITSPTFKGSKQRAISVVQLGVTPLGE